MKSLKELAEDANSTVESGYYEITPEDFGESVSGSFVNGIKNRNGRSVICEIKFASPSAGSISERRSEVSRIAQEMEQGGAAGLSVLTEPKSFSGSISNLTMARKTTSLPIIMKDIIVSKEQIKAARKIGASAVLLIEEMFSDGLTKDGLSLGEAVRIAKREELDVIVETHTKQGFATILETKCDILGINNRDLRTFVTDLETTPKLLKGIRDIGDKLLMSESGFENPGDVSRILNTLRVEGSICPNAFLIGTSVMRSHDIFVKVRGFVEGLRE